MPDKHGEPNMDAPSPGVGRFLMLAIAVSWAVWVPLILVDPPGQAASGFWDLAKNVAAWAPTLVAVTLVGMYRGRDGVSALLARLSPRQVTASWLVAAIAVPFVVVLAAVGANSVLGFGIGRFPGLADLALIVIIYSYVLVLGGPLGEELGWRGYALPQLLERHPPAVAGILLGAATTLWHTPLFFIIWAPQAAMPMGYYALYTISLSVIFTWTYLRTDGSVLVPVLLHASGNTAIGMLPVLALSEGDVPQTVFPVLALVTATLAVIVLTRSAMHAAPERPLDRPLAKRLPLRMAASVAALGLLVVLLIEGWAVTPLGPDDDALAALRSDSSVVVETSGDGIMLRPARGLPTAGLILYPGGRVDPRSYAPLAREIAEAGYMVILPTMPLNLAVLYPGRAEPIIANHPEVGAWAVGGHSLGGSMAATYARRPDSEVSGLVLLAAYPPASTDLSGADLLVVSVVGTADSILNTEAWERARVRLPEGTRFAVLDGANHAQFGSYGEQPGDSAATISAEQQRAATVDAVTALLARMSDR
jgi:membrane protease YdiL (CAAX protease family)/dienelactone hydrolase